MDNQQKNNSAPSDKKNSGNENRKKNYRPYYKNKKYNKNKKNKNINDNKIDSNIDTIAEENKVVITADVKIPEERFAEYAVPEAEVTLADTKIDDFTNLCPCLDEDIADENGEIANKTEVIGIRFKRVGKVYYFAPNGIVVKKGDSAIVETAKGLEFCEVCIANRYVSCEDVVQPLRPLIRIATAQDISHNEENHKKEADAFSVCVKKIADHKLEMKLVDAQYTFDNSKLQFSFTSSGRVDFRDLVKDLAAVFRTRIELRQIGIRDEAKLIGGLGACGRSLCCSNFLSDFTQVSIKMAKEQNLSLNSSKISGNCGRLMCCLHFEYSTYEEEIKKTPPVESVVKTPDGIGFVTDINPLAATVRVKLKDSPEAPPKLFHRDNITVINRRNSED
jgi:cell fate regulator YaaT (PSP1 superfamily)